MPVLLKSDALFYLSMVLLLLVGHLIYYFVKKNQIEYISLSGVLIAVGAFSSLAVNLAFKTRMLVFSPDLCIYVLLPCIIFESGFSFHRKEFVSNLGAILLYAILGIFISAFVIGVIVYTTSKIFDTKFMNLSMRSSLIFGALISATDPVSTLSVFNTLGVNKTLYGLVFGESVLNDAASLVLYRVLGSFTDAEFTLSDMPMLMVLFAGVFLGSAFVGLAVSILVALVLKYADLNQKPVFEIILTLIVAYILYILTDIFWLSGIVSIFSYGVGVRHYAFYNYSALSKQTSQLMFEVLAELSEQMIFVYLGLSLFPLSSAYHFGVILISLVAVFIGRFVNVFGLSYVANLFRTNVITNEMMIMIWFSGLRGAVSYSMAIHIDPFDHKGIKSTTQAIVLFTVFVMGGTTPKLVRALKLTKLDERNNTCSSSSSKTAASSFYTSLLNLPTATSEPPLLAASEASSFALKPRSAEQNPEHRDTVINGGNSADLPREEAMTHCLSAAASHVVSAYNDGSYHHPRSQFSTRNRQSRPSASSSSERLSEDSEIDETGSPPSDSFLAPAIHDLHYDQSFDFSQSNGAAVYQFNPHDVAYHHYYKSARPKNKIFHFFWKLDQDYILPAVQQAQNPFSKRFARPQHASPTETP